jgi:cytochrome c553
MISMSSKFLKTLALVASGALYLTAFAQAPATPAASAPAPAAAAPVAEKKEAPKASVERGKQIATAVCVACHGIDGNSPTSANPIIAGQGEQYIATQLKAFRDATKDPAKARRLNPVMQGFAANLTDADMQSLGMYYSRQPIKPAVARDKAAAQLGEKIYRAGIKKNDVPACAGCHGAAGYGIPAQYPRLAGQYPEYTYEELEHYAEGKRKNAQMNAIASRMTKDEMKAVAEYVAGMRTVK